MIVLLESISFGLVDSPIDQDEGDVADVDDDDDEGDGLGCGSLAQLRFLPVPPGF